MQEGYRTQQATKPQSLSYAMIDSPVGTAAWILEKFHGWSHLNKGKIEKTFSNDELISNIMIYIITNSFNTCLLYTSPSPRDRTRSRMPSSA